MKEEEVLEKLRSYKDAIIKLKEDRDFYKTNFLSLKEKAYLTIKHLVEDNIEPKEKEIFDLTNQLSHSNEKNSNLTQICDGVNRDLSNVKQLYEICKADKQRLQDQLNELQQQTQQSRQSEEQAKIAFMQEIERVVNDANNVLNEGQ